MKIILLIFISAFIFIGCQAPIRKNEYIGGYSDPCLNKVLLQLERKDTLTNDEIKTYLQLKTLCENSKTNKERVEIADNLNATIKTYYSLAGFSAIVVLVYYLAKIQ